MPLILENTRPASFWRHLAAIFYDSFLVIACWFAVGFFFSIFSKGEAIRTGFLHYLLQAALLSVWVGFFVYFWTQQGQTLGMRAWKVIICDQSGHHLTPKRALWRWLLAFLTCLPVGFGLWWRLWDCEQKTLYDRWSKTRLYTLPHNPYSSPKKGNKNV